MKQHRRACTQLNNLAPETHQTAGDVALRITQAQKQPVAHIAPACILQSPGSSLLEASKGLYLVQHPLDLVGGLEAVQLVEQDETQMSPS